MVVLQTWNAVHEACLQLNAIRLLIWNPNSDFYPEVITKDNPCLHFCLPQRSSLTCFLTCLRLFTHLKGASTLIHYSKRKLRSTSCTWFEVDLRWGKTESSEVITGLFSYEFLSNPNICSITWIVNRELQHRKALLFCHLDCLLYGLL